MLKPFLYYFIFIIFDQNTNSSYKIKRKSNEIIFHINRSLFHSVAINSILIDGRTQKCSCQQKPQLDIQKSGQNNYQNPKVEYIIKSHNLYIEMTSV